MASENEASCESDPNFAVICGFLEKFGATCGLANIDIVDLQEMLENTVEVSQELIELHVKLMRRARRSVSSNSRWERALIKTCHTFSSQDAWEIERFGYKKARISSKLRVLKELLEMQFDYNQKFKNEINKISAGELRAQPLGRDRMGRSYWYQCDGSCQIRVYKEDPDDETWTLVAKDRDGLVSLISQLTNGDTAKSSSEPVSNEDSNSVEVEKPTLDTGQDSKDEKKESDPAEKMEVEAKSLESSSRNIVEENASEDANLPDETLDKPGVKESAEESLDKPGVEESADVTHETPKTVAEENEVAPVNGDESTNVPEAATPSEEVAETATQETSEEGEKKEEKEVVKQIPQDAGENALNLCSKDLEERKDEKSGLDLSVKAPPCLRIKPITELMAQPQKKDFAGIKGKYIRGEHVDKTLMYPNPTHCGKAVQSASYDAICYKRSMQEDIYSAPTNLKHPRFDRPTLLGNKNYISYLNDPSGDIDDEEEGDDEELEDEEIEEPLMLVQGEGSGFPNQSTNQTDNDTCPIVGEEIEEAVMIVRGEGSGEDCDTGNKFETESEGNDPKDRTKEKTPLKTELREKLEKSPPPDLNNSAENVLDNNKNDDDNSSNSDDKNFNSPIKQNFFFGNSFSPNTSPLKTASLSFGATTVPVDTLKTGCASPDENHLGDVKCCSEKTEGEEIIRGDAPQLTKVPENVDNNIENLDNNGIEAREKLAEELDCVSGESSASSEHERECDATVTDASDDVKCEVGTSENMTDSVVGGDIEDAAVLVTRTDEGNAPEIETSNLDTLSQPDEAPRTIESSENGTLEDEETKDQSTPEVCESEIATNDVTDQESLKNEDKSESKPVKDPEIEEPTHKDEEYQLIPDAHTEETTSETDCINKKESLTEMTISTEENLAASSLTEITEDSPSASTDAKSPLVDVKDHINDQVDGDITTPADIEKTNDAIVEEIEEKVISLEEENEKCGKNVETKSSNEVSEEVKLVFEENQKDVCSKSIEEIQEKEEETGDTNHIANEALDETMADVTDKCPEEMNNDIVTDAKKQEVNEDPSSSNEINQIELEKLPEILPTASSNNEQNTIVEKESNKVEDDSAKGIEYMDEDSIGNSIPDMGHSDNDVNEEENDDKTDCITNSKNEITRELGEDVAKIPEDDAIKENEDTSPKAAGDNVEIKENDKVISLEEEEEEKCGKDVNAAEIVENVSIIKDKENKVETIEISDDKSIGSGIIKEVSVVLSPITSKVVEKFVGVTKENDNIELVDDKKSKTIEVEKSIAGDTSPSNENSANNEMATPIIIINDDDANDTGIEAIKAIKITSVQAKCEMPEQIKVEQNPDKTRNKIAEAPKPQPLRFLRGRRPNQMLSVKSYATRNKNLVLRKEIKPPPVLIEEKTNNTMNVMNNTDDPLLKIIKSEDATEMPTRRSTRRRPADSIEKPPVVPRIVPVEVTKRGRGRQRKIIQPEVDSKRLRLSNNRISEAPDLETIDLTSESDGRRISVKNCDESILLKGGITIKPVYNNDKKKNNGPFLSCVNIQKLKENPPEHIESPLSVASSGGGDNSDVVIIEDDPLAVPEPLNSVSAVKPAMTLNSLQFDVDPPSPPSTIITRSLRKRGITEPEIVLPSGGKRRKTKGKRQVDLELRRSIEEQKKQEVSSSDEDKKEVAAKRKPQVFKKKPDTPPIAPVKKPRAQRKKTLLGLDVPEVLEELNTTISSVRQSRRIAQLKIKEEAERRKLEEINTVDSNKEQKRKGKKNIDKDYKAEKRKRPKPPTEEEEVTTVDVPEVEEKKTKRKRRRKDRDPRKIFDESNPWRSSSDSSSSNDDVEEEEEEIVEYSEAESPLFKSDHEFSPESDIEDGEGAALPLKRARTARKEDEDIEEDTDEHACQKCGKSDHPEWILLCDGCDNGWHCSCLRPALFIIPEGDWFCPPCQHNSLVKQLETKLVEYDKKMAKREIEVRRKERLAYVGISLANVLPVKDGEEKRKKKEENSEDDEGESASIQSESSSESSSSSDSDEPIYQLRQRRQAHSYRFNDYDDLINSAIQDEMEAVKGAGNQGRGKDISTIVNAEKEEMENNKQEKEPEELPPVVPQESKELPPAVVPPSHDHDSEEEEKLVKPAKKLIGRKKQRKLNSLDVSSGDDPDSDEDFKGSSSEEEDEDDFEEDLGSDSSEAYGRRRKGMPVRRSTRARTSRYDKDFINDDSDDDELPRKKKSRSIWDESESEESDRSWGRSSRRKSKRASGSKKKRSKKSKKHFDDSEEDRSKKKKRRIKYGGLNDDDDEEEEIGGRRTRGKKINYADVLASDSEDEVKRRAPPRIESDDDYVANEEEQEEQDDEDFEKEESGEDKKDESQKKDDENPPPNPEESKEPDPAPIPPQIHPAEAEKPAEIDTIPEQENFDIDNLNSSIDDLPDDLDNDEDDGLNPIEEINKNLEEMDEEEMEKLMEEEEYANKQLQLMAMQLEKEKKRREREAKKKEMALASATVPAEKSPKKRGKKNKQQGDTSPSSNVVQIGALQVGPDMQSNPELSEPPGITIPIFSEIPPPVDASPKKRRGRGKGKKTLEKEAAAAAAAAGSVTPTSTPATTTPSAVASDAETTHIPTTVDTVASIGEDMSLANAAALHGAKLAVAAPPQPFSQTQPTPSVITRMLQAQPGQGGYSPMGVGHNYYADQPPQHAENPAQVVANAQIPVGNSLGPPGNHNQQQLPPMSQSPQQYMHGTPQPRGLSSTSYRQPPPNVNPYHRSSPAPPVRVRTPAPTIPNVYHSHHPLDPSPSGGGPINVPPATINNPDSPVSIPPSSDSPLSNKSDPTPPPPPYNRPPMRFTNVNTTPPMSSSPIRQQPQQPQQQQQQSQNLLSPQQHLPQQQQQQQQSSPLRNNLPPYHPAGISPNYYAGYMPGNIGTEDALPPTGYHYSDQFSETNSPQDLGKGYDEENSGEFGGLVSYFSSQREDDLDT